MSVARFAFQACSFSRSLEDPAHPRPRGHPRVTRASERPVLRSPASAGALRRKQQIRGKVSTCSSPRSRQPIEAIEFAVPKHSSAAEEELTVPADLAERLGVRRTLTLRRIIRRTALPPEVLLDLALELLDIASQKLSTPPGQRQAVGLGAARWRNIRPETRSEALRRAARARGRKYRKEAEEADS
jgi:hypothetical protein